MRATSPTVDSRPNAGRGLGIATEPSDQIERNPAPSKEAMSKLNQIISVALVYPYPGKRISLTPRLFFIELPHQSRLDHSSFSS